MLTTTLLTLVLLSPAQTEEACKTCWNATCADLKDFGIPACQGKPKPAQPKKEPQAPSTGQGKAGDGKEAGQMKGEPKTGLTWVWMPSGSFHYGCEPQDTQCNDDEKPGQRRSVEGFWMMQTETTVAAYKACADAGVCPADQLQGDSEQKTCNGPNGRSDHPMNCVDWDAAGAFCRFVSGRLPTAVEWEYAAKSGSSRIYPWGNDAVTGRRANFCDANCPSALGAADKETWTKNGWITFGEDDGWAGTAPVGSFPRGDTPWGLKDMAGNVLEWTSSAYDSSNKETRGGSWPNSPPALRAGNRLWYVPGWRLGSYGFRCAQ